MLDQIFKSEIPPNLLFDLLEKVCLKTEKYYLIDINAYKKLLYQELHTEFLESLSKYYHWSKQFYLERKFTYPSFTNIVRQICKHGNIRIESEIKYNHSHYFITFFVYYWDDKVWITLNKLFVKNASSITSSCILWKMVMYLHKKGIMRYFSTSSKLEVNLINEKK